MIVDLYSTSSEPSRLSYHQPQARLQPLPNYPPKHSIPVAISPCGRSAMLWQAAKPGGSLSWEECAPWTDSQNGLICVWSAHALAFTIVFILLSRMLVGVSNHTRILKVLEFCLHCQSRCVQTNYPKNKWCFSLPHIKTLGGLRAFHNFKEDSLSVKCLDSAPTCFLLGFSPFAFVVATIFLNRTLQ